VQLDSQELSDCRHAILPRNELFGFSRETKQAVARLEHRGGQHLFGNAVLRPLIQVDTVLERSEPLGANQEPKVDASFMPIG